MTAGAVTVVVITRDRAEGLLATLGHLRSLPEEPPVIVIDNASTDDTSARVRARFPEVDLVRLERNRGAVARNLGVERATTPYVAFADDDSWWAPGSLARAAACFDATPDLALVAARILVGPEERTDPVSLTMARSPLPTDGDGPGPAVLGFVACGAVVRRRAHLAVGGFDPLIGFLGEEDALAIDLARSGWRLAYVDDVVAHHHPQPVGRDPVGRDRLQRRNRLLTVWSRRSPATVLTRTGASVRAAARDPVERGALLDAGRRLPSAIRRRRPPGAALEAQLRLLDRPEHETAPLATTTAATPTTEEP